MLVRISQLALVCVLIAVTAGATDSEARFKKDSHELMCGCGCNQLLGECNHVGCPDSDGMRNELMAAVSRGSPRSTAISGLIRISPTWCG